MINTTKEYGDRVAVKLFEIMKKNSNPLTNQQIYSLIVEALLLTDEDKNKKYKSGSYVYQNHTQFGLLGLKVMNLVDHIARGKWAISKQGKSKDSLSVDEYSDFQRKYWNKAVAKKRKAGSEKNQTIKLENIFNRNLSKDKKEQILSEILEQNKRILDYIWGKK